MATKKTVNEEVKATAKKVADKVTATEIETKKAVRGAARKTKAKVAETKEKLTGKSRKRFLYSGTIWRENCMMILSGIFLLTIQTPVIRHG